MNAKLRFILLILNYVSVTHLLIVASKVCSYGVVLQGAESKLAKFVEDIIVPPRMVDIVIDGEVIKCFA